MLYYLTFGLALGMAAGFSPGPLLTLVISETLTHGLSSGIKVALAPIITDAPIVLVTFLIATQFSDVNNILGIISLIGGCYVLYMAYKSTKQKDQQNTQINTKPRSLLKGVITNALSPHPYLFWLSVGAPTVAKSINISVITTILFISGFYLMLVGSKVFLAVLVGKSKTFLSGEAYIYTMRFLAFTLGIFAIILFIDGLTLLGVYEV